MARVRSNSDDERVERLLWATLLSMLRALSHVGLPVILFDRYCYYSLFTGEETGCRIKYFTQVPSVGKLKLVPRHTDHQACPLTCCLPEEADSHVLGVDFYRLLTVVLLL